MRRRRRIVPSGSFTSSPMIVLAGLPPDVHTWTTGSIRELRPNTVVIGSPSSPSDNKFLYPRRLIQILTKSITGFAIRRRNGDPAGVKAPKSITLLYVPSEDQEDLLQAFDFTVMCESLSILAAYGQNGSQLRHDRKAVGKALEQALGPTSQAKVGLEHVMQRVSRLAERDAMLLPPRNYSPQNGTLEELFREFRRGTRGFDDRLNELPLKALTKSDLPRLPTGEVRHVHVDTRGIAFLVAHPNAYDGAKREVEEDAPLTEWQSVLQSLYRFGAALPNGFHHDVQKDDGKKFDNFIFKCKQDGPVKVSGTHANIYANDFIRAEMKTKI